MDEVTKTLLDFHQEEIERHQAEIEKLTSGPVKPEPMFGQSLNISKETHWLDSDGVARDVGFISNIHQGNCFISKEAAELEAEKRRLRQLARVRMVESWGGNRPDWSKSGQYKYCIYPNGDIHAEDKVKHLLYFRTLDHANDFMDEVGEIGIQLIWEL